MSDARIQTSPRTMANFGVGTLAQRGDVPHLLENQWILNQNVNVSRGRGPARA
jgi:hypothetical protein